jgi:rubrerythrin
MKDEWPRKWERLLRQAMVNESMLAELYAHYAELFPEHGRVWAVLARAERKHAAAFLDLLEELPPAGAEAILHKFRPELMNAVESRLAAMLESVRNRNVTADRAVTNAISMESSLMENLMAVFETAMGGSRVQQVAGQLLRETRHHRGMVMRLLAGGGDS